jgi:succinate dehydrogenase / fumarate reductase cytochrome b subunit
MQRPVSPHFTVYRMTRYTLLTSILNRATGLVLSLALIVLVYWLMAVAGGRQSFNQALAVLSWPPLKLLYLGLILAGSYHLVAGIRHLVWDTGTGMERAQAQRSAWIVTLATLLLTALVVWALFRSGWGAGSGYRFGSGGTP